MKTRLFQSFILAIILSTTSFQEGYCQDTIPSFFSTKLIASYAMDGNAYDEISGTNGTITGNPIPIKNRFQEENAALKFSNDGIIINPILNGMSKFTFSGWVRNDGTSTGYRSIMSKVEGSTRDFQLRFSPEPDNFLTSYKWGGGIEYASALNILPKTGIWQHLVWIFDDGDITFYEDGIKKATGSYGELITWTGANISFGRLSPTATEYFGGDFDDFKLFNAALDSLEVAELYNFEAMPQDLSGQCKWQYSLIDSSLITNRKVGIKTANPKYDLSVNGQIGAKELILTPTNWPDYVFDNNYNLLPLDQLKQFIKVEKHLPNIKPSSEVLTKGIEIGETNKLLLEKIEELTLYILDLNERIKELEQK